MCVCVGGGGGVSVLGVCVSVLGEVEGNTPQTQPENQAKPHPECVESFKMDETEHS